MNTTPHLIGHTFKTVEAGKLNVGDKLMRCHSFAKTGASHPDATSLFEDEVTAITLSGEGYVSLRLKSGDLSMREVGSAVLIRTI